MLSDESCVGYSHRGLGQLRNRHDDLWITQKVQAMKVQLPDDLPRRDSSGKVSTPFLESCLIQTSTHRSVCVLACGQYPAPDFLHRTRMRRGHLDIGCDISPCSHPGSCLSHAFGTRIFCAGSCHRTWILTLWHSSLNNHLNSVLCDLCRTPARKIRRIGGSIVAACFRSIFHDASAAGRRECSICATLFVSQTRPRMRCSICFSRGNYTVNAIKEQARNGS